MKNFIKYTSVFFLIASVMVSCKKDDETTPSSGYFKIDNQKFDLNSACAVYYNDEEGTVEVIFYSDGIRASINGMTGHGDVVSFILSTDTSSYTTSIKEGEYIFNEDENEEFTYFELGLYENYNFDQGNNSSDNFWEGSNDIKIKIEKQGNDYIVSFSGMNDDNNSIEFYYKGQINYLGGVTF